jgi:hypothetical protein
MTSRVAAYAAPRRNDGAAPAAHSRRPLWLLLIALPALVGCATSHGTQQSVASRPATQAMETAMSEDNAKILSTSKDPKELSPAACALARSEQQRDQDVLLRHLCSSDFLGRLDTADDYAAYNHRPRIGRVLQMLRDNKSAAARQTLLALTKDGTFLKEMRRVDELIRATPNIRPAPPELVAFWDKHSQPLDSFAPNTFDALCENGTRPALDLLEKKLADSAHDEDERTGWMRRSILPRRNNLAIIECGQRMLTGSLPERLRPALVEVFFDYKPEEWFTPADNVTPPERGQLGPSGRVALRALAQVALKNVKLNDEQRQAIEKTLKELEESR